MYASLKFDGLAYAAGPISKGNLTAGPHVVWLVGENWTPHIPSIRTFRTGLVVEHIYCKV